MSRYSERLQDGREVVWGYDEPLNEYFVSVYKSPNDMKGVEEELVFSIANWNTLIPHPDTPEKFKYTNDEISDILIDFHVAPISHILSIALNSPF